LQENIPKLRAAWQEIKQWQQNETDCRRLSREIANASIMGKLDEAHRLIEQRRPLLIALKPEPGSRRPRKRTTTPALKRRRSPSPEPTGTCLLMDDDNQ